MPVTLATTAKKISPQSYLTDRMLALSMITYIHEGFWKIGKLSDPGYTNAIDLKELILERVKRERDYTMGVYQ